eukprot:CAMPEP_0174385276 /NCGR_PEP_ID=MMETSP0811_2-20130205/126491_1 /TAXON_ID=73025 ORGANISM="Eutreptiella gymnastica-like, Strain CCMP1594" /NCGR_SAMPLE_ID=MMETSP0811_2 /ASSEMBLY_ACC=CAM_ASM_000667 /LENGTH=72 /DNA_ID=CAMNT_0015539535 /DNA_START=989 /DNA_END=1204 /DNA_ORIENTATION=-
MAPRKTSIDCIGRTSALGSPKTRNVATLPHSALAACLLAVIGCTLTYGSQGTRCGAALPMIEVGRQGTTQFV